MSIVKDKMVFFYTFFCDVYLKISLPKSDALFGCEEHIGKEKESELISFFFFFIQHRFSLNE